MDSACLCIPLLSLFEGTHLGAGNHRAISQHQLKGEADVLEEAMLVGGCLYPSAHDQPSCGSYQAM